MKQIGSVDEAIAKKLAEFSSRSDIGATADFAAQVMTADLRPKLAEHQGAGRGNLAFQRAGFRGHGRR